MHWPSSDSLNVFVFLRFAVIASGCASCPRLVCHREGCGAEFCYHCKQAWHPNQTCDSARQQRAQSLHTHSNHSPSYTQEQGPSECLEALHCAASPLSSCQPRVNLMYPGLDDINQCSVALVTTVNANSHLQICWSVSTDLENLLPFPDIFASPQLSCLHQSLSHQHSPSFSTLIQLCLSDRLPAVSTAD